MRRKQVAAILLSAVLSLSGCLSLDGFRVLAAENTVLENESEMLREEPVEFEGRDDLVPDETASEEKTFEDSEGRDDLVDAIDAAASDGMGSDEISSEETAGEEKTSAESTDDPAEAMDRQDYAFDKVPGGTSISEEISETEESFEEEQTSGEESHWFKAWVEGCEQDKDSDWKRVTYDADTRRIGDSMTLEVLTEASEGNTLFYEWSIQGEDAIVPVEGAVSSTFEAVMYKTEWNDFYCTVTDSYDHKVEIWFTIYANDNPWLHASEISLGSPGSAAFTEEARWVPFIFTPDSDGIYTFYTVSDYNIYAYLYDSNDQELGWYGEGGEGDNFRFSEKLNAGETYLLNVTEINSEDCTCTVYVEKPSFTVLRDGQEDCMEVFAGEEVTMTVEADAQEPLTYTWFEGRHDWGDELHEIQDAPNASLTLTPGDVTNYSCRITDGTNEGWRYFSISVRHARAWLSGYEELKNSSRQEVNLEVSPGEEAVLAIESEKNSEDTLVYEWYKVVDGDDDGNHETILLEGVTGSSYTTDPVNSAVHILVIAQLEDQEGNRYSQTSIDIHLDVEDYLKAWPAGHEDGKENTKQYIEEWEGEDNLCDGDTYNIEILWESKDGNKPTFQWYKNEDGNTPSSQWFENNEPIEGANTSVYEAFLKEGTNDFVCRVQDKHGNEVIIECVLTAKPNYNIETAHVTFEGPIVYTGEALTPAATVLVGTRTLQEGTDYTVTYENNIEAGTDTGRAILTGTGSYTGTLSAVFTIDKAEQVMSAAYGKKIISVGKTGTITVNGAAGAVTYASKSKDIASVSADGVVTGKKVGTVKITVTSSETNNYKKAVRTVTIGIVPAATAKFTAENQTKGIKLTWSRVTGATGYIVYRDNKNVKTITNGSTVTWTDTAAVTNGTKYTYKIYARAATGTSTLFRSLVIYQVVQPAVKTLTYNNNNTVTLTWAKNDKANGYTIQYSLNSGFSSSKTVTINKNSTVKTTLTGLKKESTYYVRIRTYKKSGTNTYYSAWSSKKSCLTVTRASSLSSALSYVRNQAKARKSSIKVIVPEAVYKKLDKKNCSDVLAHTKDPAAGDYLASSAFHAEATAKKTTDGKYLIEYYFAYNDTAAEEQKAAAATKRLVASLKLKSKSLSNYEKIKRIYRYIVKNVEYDYDTLDSGGKVYPEKYTGYGAIVRKKAVCGGISAMFYRLCLEAGIDCRCIKSGKVTKYGHAWNIVKLGKAYYLVDCTWDGEFYHTYNVFPDEFLHGKYFFETHRNTDDQFHSASFAKKYPLFTFSYGKKFKNYGTVQHTPLMTINNSIVSTQAENRRAKVLIYVFPDCNYADDLLKQLKGKKYPGVDIIVTAYNAVENYEKECKAIKARIGKDFPSNTPVTYAFGGDTQGIYTNLRKKMGINALKPMSSPTVFLINSRNQLVFGYEGICNLDGLITKYLINKKAPAAKKQANLKKNAAVMGLCGDHAYWLFSKDGTLRICGKGKLWENMSPETQIGWVAENEKNSYLYSPVHIYRKQIKKIIVEKDITYLGARMFYACDNLKSVTFKGHAPAVNWLAKRGDHPIFNSVLAPNYLTIYYPAKDSTWTDSAKNNMTPYTNVKWIAQ